MSVLTMDSRAKRNLLLVAVTLDLQPHHLVLAGGLVHNLEPLLWPL